MYIDNEGDVVIEGSATDNSLNVQEWFLAAINGDLDKLKAMSKEENSYLGARGDKEMTALMYAAGSGMVKCVKFLLQHRQEVAQHNSDGTTAMMFAAMNGFADCIKLLLPYESGLKDNEGRDALYFAEEGKYEDCIKLLKNKPDNKKNNKDNKLENSEIAALKEELNNYIEANKELTKAVSIGKKRKQETGRGV